MAESTLSLNYDDISVEVGYYLGWQRNSALWSLDQHQTINSVIRSGLRQFYVPPPLPGEPRTHEWSFLRPIGTLNIFPAPAGLISSVSGNHLTVTASAFWPDVAATGADLVGDKITLTDVSANTSETLVIQEILSATELITTTSATGTYTSNDKFAISRDADFVLGDDFGGLDGSLTFTGSSTRGPITVTGESIIRDRREGQSIGGIPRLAAVRPLAATGTSGQRFEIMIWPNPDAAYVVEYRYHANLNSITSVSKVPAGGMPHAETILASCLAIAEQRINDERGLRWQQFMERLVASVLYDRQNMSPDSIGYIGDPGASTSPLSADDYRRSFGGVNVTVGNVQY